MQGEEKVLGEGQFLHEFRRRKYRRIILLHPGSEEFPDRWVGVRKVDMAAPNPMSGLMAPPQNQRHGLRVMNHREFGIHRQARQILPGIG